MNIKTKFNLGDLTKSKHSRRVGFILGLEIMEVTSQTCTGGTQVFCKCRIVQAEEEFNYDAPKEQGKPRTKRWMVGTGHHGDTNDLGWKTYREDELVPLTKKEEAIIKGEG